MNADHIVAGQKTKQSSACKTTSEQSGTDHTIKQPAAGQQCKTTANQTVGGQTRALVTTAAGQITKQSADATPGVTTEQLHYNPFRLN